MNTYFTADLHIGHQNILRHCPARGERWSTVEDMNQGIVDSINLNVKEDDELWILGDLCFGKGDLLVWFLKSLTVRKVRIVPGNHDSIGRLETAVIMAGKGTIMPPLIRTRFGVFCHFALRTWEAHHRGEIHLHGHSHGSLPPLGRSVDIGFDAPWVLGQPAHRPVSWDEIQRFMTDRQPHVNDHHMEATGV